MNCTNGTESRAKQVGFQEAIAEYGVAEGLHMAANYLRTGEWPV